MRKVSFDELMAAVDLMAANPYTYTDDQPEDMEYNGYQISFRKSCQFNQAVVSRPGANCGTLVHYSDRVPMHIHCGTNTYTPREYFIAYVTGELEKSRPDPNAYGYVNGRPVYSHDEFAIAVRKFGPIESDADLIGYAEKETGHWSQAGHCHHFTDYFLSENDHLNSVLTVSEWKRLCDLQKAAKAAEKAADGTC